MQTPLILNENGDITFFRDNKGLEGYVEVTDVKNNEYLAFDSNGNQLEFNIDNNIISLVDGNEKNCKSDQLLQSLIEFSHKVNSNISTNNISLNELISSLVDKYGYTE